MLLCIFSRRQQVIRDYRQIVARLTGPPGQPIVELVQFPDRWVIEEPSAAGVHEHEVALHFQQSQGAHFFFVGQPTQRMLFSKITDVCPETGRQRL